MPIYKATVVVTMKPSDETAATHRLIEADNKAQALKFLCRDMISIEVCEGKQLVALGKAGVEVESAGVEG